MLKQLLSSVVVSSSFLSWIYSNKMCLFIILRFNFETHESIFSTSVSMFETKPKSVLNHLALS